MAQHFCVPCFTEPNDFSSIDKGSGDGSAAVYPFQPLVGFTILINVVLFISDAVSPQKLQGLLAGWSPVGCIDNHTCIFVYLGFYDRIKHVLYIGKKAGIAIATIENRH